MVIYAGDVARRARGGDCDWEGLGGEGARTTTSGEGGKGVPARLGGPYAGHACMGVWQVTTDDVGSRRRRRRGVS